MLDRPAGTVQVYWAPRSAARDGWLPLLDPAERRRHDAYRRREDRDRFLVGAVLVRLICARELSIEPARVRLDRGCPECGRPHGKVRLAAGQEPLELSVSHSGDWVVVAACRSGAVGVDVERISPTVDHTGVARIAFAAAEATYLAGLPPDARAAAFTRYWTRKEAVAKALGEGLRTPLSAIEVSAPDQPAAVVAWSGRPERLGTVRLHDLTDDERHRASLAVICPTEVRVIEHDATQLLGGA
ncbi:MAG: 4'-phosphopantetheinyl transferase superfamily protein [Actinomycetota bacterium]|nr:4'-phosphopantetheinyl transferase superfamily protein [Actinomycetota bacterium]